MPKSKIWSKLNPFGQCKEYEIPLRQCPQFLFFVMGIFIAFSSIVFYFIGENYITDPRIVALAVLAIAGIFSIIAFVVTSSFQNLAEANRIKTEFVNIVSHQLRAPLTNLRWATEFLLSNDLEKADVKERNSYFDIIKENGNRMENLIDDLLTITRLRNGKMNTHKTNFLLEDLTKEVIVDNRRFLEASNVEIKLSSSKNLPRVFASRSLIKIVTENLISNAIRYSHSKGKILVHIRPKGNQVLFEIKDQGIGIPAEDQKYLFQKFFRAKNAVHAEIYGTGLGLFIVNLILKSMKGKVWFKSQEGKGSTFYFTLPTRG